MKAENKLPKLMGVERKINVYKNPDQPELIEEVYIDILLEKLKTIVNAKDEDPLLYRGYILNQEQLTRLNVELQEAIKPDYALFYYVLECDGIYDW